MATTSESNICSICNKTSARCFCIGCKNYFCSKDFREHEQQLSIKFDDEVVRSHDELLDRIKKFETSDQLLTDVFSQIEKWEKTTIDKIEKAAQQARQQLTELIHKKRTSITEQLELITREIRSHRNEENFLEYDIDRLKTKLNGIQQTVERFLQPDTNIIVIDDNRIDWNRIIYVPNEKEKGLASYNINLGPNAQWIQNGVTLAGGNGFGTSMNQLYYPYGFFIDNDHTLYIAEWSNHRITEWKSGETIGRVVAGGNGQGNHLDQLSCPTDVILDKIRDQLIICDSGNRRVVRWPRQNGIQGEILISNIGCQGLTIDNEGFLYIVDYNEHEVKRYRMGDNQALIVAGGHGPGNRLDQLNYPKYVFVDQDHAVYVSDTSNHRVVKWNRNATEGIVVAGTEQRGNSLAQLSNPYGIAVDQSGTVYVADYLNNRVVRWPRGATQGIVVIGDTGSGNRASQLNGPVFVSFDDQGDLYVSDYGNFRIQKFELARS